MGQSQFWKKNKGKIMLKKIGIICAGDDELAPFLEELEVSGTVEKAMLKFYEGKLCGFEVVILFCGACKVNAAIATQILIDTFHVDTVINAGTAGGMDPALKIFDTVISTEVAYHDVEEEILTEFHPWMKSVFFAADEKLLNYAKKAAPKISTKGKIYFGRMVTGEAFITDDGRQEIIDKFNPLSVDMETGSIAHVCYVNKIPFIAIRTVTDTAEHSGSGTFEENLKESSKIAKEVTKAVLQEMSK